MNIFCFQILNEADDLARSSVLNSGSIALSNAKTLLKDEAKKSLEVKDSQIESDSSLSGSNKSSTTSLAEFRNFHSFSN